MTQLDSRTGWRRLGLLGSATARWLELAALTILMCATLGFSPLYLNAYSDVKQCVAIWALGLLSPAALVTLWLGWQRRLPLAALAFAAGWGLLVAGFTASLMHTLNPFEGWKWWCFYSGVAVCGLTAMVVSLCFRAFVERLAWLTTLMLLVVGFYGILQWLRVDPLQTVRLAGMRVEFPVGYPGATFGNANFAVQFTAPAIVLALGLLIRCQQPGGRRTVLHTVVTVGAILAGVAHLCVTQSRGGLMALVCGLGVATVLLTGGGTVRLGGVRFRVPLVALILILITAAGGMVSGTVTRLVRDDARSVGSTAAYRLDIWRASWTMALAAWPAGVGPGQFDILLPRYDSGRLGRHSGGNYAAERVNRAHNDYLDFLAEGGAAAVGAFFLIACSVTVSLMRNRQRRDPLTAAASAAVAAIAVHASVDFPLHSPASAVLLALLAGCIVTVHGELRREVSHACVPPRTVVAVAGLTVLGILVVLAVTTPARFLLSQHLGRFAVARRSAAKTAQAMEALKSATQVAPANREIRALMTAVARDTGDTTAAREAASVWVRLEPWSTSAHNALGAALAEEGETTAAVESFRKALAIAPTNHAARINAATALYLNGHFCEAYELYREAVHAAPELVEGVVRNYADAAIECGVTAESLQLLRRYVAANPADGVMRQKYESARRGGRQ